MKILNLFCAINSWQYIIGLLPDRSIIYLNIIENVKLFMCDKIIVKSK